MIKNFTGTIDDRRQMLIDMEENLYKSIDKKMDKMKNLLQNSIASLAALNPIAVLQRGYSVTFKDGNTVKSAEQVSSGDKIKTILADGDIESVVV